MIANTKYILILLFMGLLLQVSALDSEKTNNWDPSAGASNIAMEGDKKAEMAGDSKAKNLKNKKSRQKRQVAGMAYNCSEFWTDEFSVGYVQVGSRCSSDDGLCVAFFHVARNYCEEDHLVRYYCDPKQPSLFSTEKIKCKKSCEFSGLSGACIK